MGGRTSQEEEVKRDNLNYNRQPMATTTTDTAEQPQGILPEAAQTTFERLIAARDIDTLLAQMDDRGEAATAALKEYNASTHEVCARPDKVVTDKQGNVTKRESVWKLPVPYQVYINELPVVFLYGRPVRWRQQSEGTDEAFNAFLQLLKDTRFDAKVRQCKRLAGAETQAAMLWRTYKGDDGQPAAQIRVLAQSKGDHIYTLRDQYENLLYVAWGYAVTEGEEELVRHVDIFTPATTYHCAQRDDGWHVDKEENLVGKIPIILFQQRKEWEGVEALINREEWIASHTADTNDYFADPIAIMSAEVIKNLPERKEAGKLLITNDRDGVNNAARYLTWDSAPQSKLQELDWLRSQILSKTFTPDITLDTLRSCSSLSAKALRTVMMLADIKAARLKETHDELLDRTASLATAIIGHVTDVRLRAQCDRLRVAHEWSEPFGEDVAEGLANVAAAFNSGLLSRETAIELNPVSPDPLREKERIAAEEQATERQREEQDQRQMQDVARQRTVTEDDTQRQTPSAEE